MAFVIFHLPGLAYSWVIHSSHVHSILIADLKNFATFHNFLDTVNILQILLYYKLLSGCPFFLFLLSNELLLEVYFIMMLICLHFLCFQIDLLYFLLAFYFIKFIILSSLNLNTSILLKARDDLAILYHEYGL